MKKALLGTTALVAGGLLATPAMAADPIKLELRGYFQAMIVLGKIDKDFPAGIGGPSQKYEPENLKYEGEIWFTGTTKLDNGTSIGIRVELEAWSQAAGGDQMDHEFIFAFGDWGRIEFGGHDSASYIMQYSSPSALNGWGFNDHNFNYFGNGFNGAQNAGRGGNILGTGAAHNAGFSGDANKITYFTPRFAGFQVGFSYTPSFGAIGALHTITNCASRTGGGNFSNCAKDNDAWKRGIDISANYLNKFGDFSVALYGAYATAAFDRGASGLGNNFRRYKTWAAGAQLGIAGFTLGGGLGRDNMGLVGNNAVRWYTASLMYETGPWQMSVGWWGGRNKDTLGGALGTPGKDELNYFELGVNYALAPGVKLTAGAFTYQGKGQDRNENADSWAVVFGTALTF